MPDFIKPDGSNPWNLRLTQFHRGLAQVTPEEVEHFSGPGLEEAKQTFSDISSGISVTTPKGTKMSGAQSPRLFTSESAKMEANRKSGIPQVERMNQITMYLEPSTSGGHEGCNTCGFETAGCSKACLAESGRLSSPASHIARTARTLMAMEHPAKFWGLMAHEINQFKQSNIKKGLGTAVRTGGTSEGLFHLMQGSEAIHGQHPDIDFIEYTKTQSRDRVGDPRLFVPRNYRNVTPVVSVTENTTIPRLLEASQEQGLHLAVPFTRAPHSRYPEEITMVDRQGRSAAFKALLSPVTGEALGDATDIRSKDTEITGITGGIIPLGAKKILTFDEQGRGTKGVTDTTFIREVNPSRQTAKFQRHGEWKGEQPVSAPRRRGR